MDKLLSNADNGVSQLLNEIRKHAKDMPEEIRDDLSFGALVVIYQMGKLRGKWTKANSVAIVIIFLTIVALHGNVPWLEGIVKTIFG